MKLLELAKQCGTDKASNGYIEFYEELFKKLSLSSTLLELGTGPACASLRMWAEYLPAGHAIGIDCHPQCADYSGPGKLFLGNLMDESFTSQVLSLYPQGFDIIVDDAGHHVEQQKYLFQRFFPYVKDGGFYCVEDVGTSYFPSFGGGFRKEESFVEFAKTLWDIINRRFWRSDSMTSHIAVYNPDIRESPPYKDEQSIKGIRLYNALCIIEKW